MDAEEPGRSAAAAAERARVEVRLLRTREELGAACGVWDAAWPTSDGTTEVAPNFLRAIEHAGGYVAGAFERDRMIGAILAIVGRRHDAAGWHVHLHSHMAATKPGAGDRGIGRAMKLHQRAWALENGIDEVTWTFDPLVRRNARLNLNRLGALVRYYYVDFYGEMPDAINAGHATDRLLAFWAVGSDEVAAALAGRRAERSSAELIDSGAVSVLQVVSGEPHIAEGEDFAAAGRSWLFALPGDITEIRRSDPDRARRWRSSLRDTLGAAIAAGHAVRELTSDGAYVISSRT